MAKKSKSSLPALPKPPGPGAKKSIWDKYLKKLRIVVSYRKKIAAIKSGATTGHKRKRR